MTITASELFDFLDRHNNCTIERHEIASPVFGILRRSLRQIVLKLRDSDDQDALNASDRLRVLLSEWLTVPVSFDHSMLDALVDTLGPAQAVQSRWGSDIRKLYDTARDAADDLQSIANPMREKLHEVISDLLALKRTFKIYCHRQARIHYESILAPPKAPPFPENTFLHSVRDYRETGPFDVLIKIGPLRARGWGSAPDSLLTAPRYCAIFQIVWSGCSDDPDFGYDPVSLPRDTVGAGEASPGLSANTHPGPVEWTTQTTHVGVDPGVIAIDDTGADELRVFREMNQLEHKRRATVVQIGGNQGILYPPHSQVLSFAPNLAESEPISLRLPRETLHEGMFVIIPLIDDVDLGGVQAELGYYSQIWKARLEHELQADAEGLVRRLREADLNLTNLGSAIRRWCELPSTVIHAPQRIKHFEILLRVLGVDSGSDPSHRQARLPFWQLAWNEVRRSRGEAIQAGFQEHEIVGEELLAILGKLMPEIRKRAVLKGQFRLAIPGNYGIKGTFLFLRVGGIEDGFSAPETEFRVIRDLNTIDQWRD